MGVDFIQNFMHNPNDMQNGCQFYIKFHEESNNKLNFYLRSYPMKAEVKADWNFEQSFIKSK